MSILPTLKNLVNSKELNSATLRQVYILHAVASGPQTILSLAAQMHCPKPSVVRSVDFLCAWGLVERKLNLADRRQVFVLLTREGKALIHRSNVNG